MKQIRFSLALVLAVALLGLGLLPAAQPAVAQQGTTVTSAVFSVFIANPSGETVNIRRITVPWIESTVTWASFGSSFVPLVPNVSFASDSVGWHSADVTALVQGWHDGTFPNYGLALDEGSIPFAATLYHGSEFATPELRPRLDVTYTVAGGPPVFTSYTIQRPNGTVNDAYVWALNPTTNYNYEVLYTGNLDGGGAKYALIQFERLPTAVQLQSLSARSSVAPELGLAAVGIVGAAGAVLLRRRREQ